MIERARAAITSRATNGSATVKSGRRIAGVNRAAGGVYSVHFTDDLVNVQCCVKVSLNAGDATHRFHGYNRISTRQIDVILMDTAGAGTDVDFSIEVFADNDASIGA